MNKIIQSKLKQSSKKQFLIYYPGIELSTQLLLSPKKTKIGLKKSRNKPDSDRRSAPSMERKLRNKQERDELKEYFSSKLSNSLKLRKNRQQNASFEEGLPCRKSATLERRPRQVYSAISRRKNDSQIAPLDKKDQFKDDIFDDYDSLPTEQFSIPGVKFKTPLKWNPTQKGQNEVYTQILSTQKSTSYHNSPQKISSLRTRQKMINIEQILSRNFTNFSQMMVEYYRRANIKPDALIFVFNSQDTWFKNALIKRGWIQNMNNQSKAYHLIWSYRFPKEKPYSSQLVNHYSNSQIVTYKSRLHQTLKLYGFQDIQPKTFDIDEEKQEFCKQFYKIEFIGMLQQHLKEFLPENYTCKYTYKQTITNGYILLRSLKNTRNNDEKLQLQNILRFGLNLLEDRADLGRFYYYPAHQLQYRSFKEKWEQEDAMQILRCIYFYLKSKEGFQDVRNNVWILKSRAGSKGAGIALSNNLSNILKTQYRLVQKYIQRPLLLNKTNKHKFDIRLWVLVKGSNNISIYFYEQFYGRISSERYKLDTQSLKDHCIHLTNYSINKISYDQRNQQQSSVLFADQLFEEIKSQYQFDYQKQFYQQIQALLLKLRPIFMKEVCKGSSRNQFQLFGIDLLIDYRFKMHFLEINSSPKCENRHPKLSKIISQMADGLLDIIEGKKEQKRWRKVK